MCIKRKSRLVLTAARALAKTRLVNTVTALPLHSIELSLTSSNCTHVTSPSKVGAKVTKYKVEVMHCEQVSASAHNRQSRSKDGTGQSVHCTHLRIQDGLLLQGEGHEGQRKARPAGRIYRRKMACNL